MDLVKRSLKIIKDLQLKNGGILATFKNDAYSYVYPRDGVIMTKALNIHGFYKNSERFYYFLKSVKGQGDIACFDQRYLPIGLPYVTQRGEHDLLGLVIHGILDTFNHSSNQKFLHDMWTVVEDCVACIGQMSDGLVYSKRSIHEFAGIEEGYEIWVNSACCRGLYDAAEIAKILGKNKESKLLRLQAEKLKKNIVTKLFDKRRKIFIKTLKTSGEKILSPDTSQLAPFYFDIVESKTILENTLRLLKKTIWHKRLGGFLRFKSFELCKNWHWYTGGDGPFTVFTMIATRFFKLIKDEKSFERCWDWIHKIPTREGYFPERFSLKKDYEEWKKNEWEFSERITKGIKKAESIKPPIKGVIYWATPLGWSHSEYIFLTDFISKS